MRKSVIFSGLGGCLLLATAVIAADGENQRKDDGPGMTTSQKFASLFGLIDRGSKTPPPTPPGMPPMNSHGSVRLPFAQKNRQPATTQRTTAGSTAARNVAGRDASLPQPPQPLKMSHGESAPLPPTASNDDGGAVMITDDQHGPKPVARSSIVGASKSPSPLFPNMQPAAGVASGKASAGWNAAAGTNAAKSPQPMETLQPFVSSRRRTTTPGSSPSIAAEAAPEATVEQSRPVAQAGEPPALIADDAKMPAIPMLIEESPAAAPPKVASANVSGTPPALTSPRAEPARLPTGSTPAAASSTASAQPRENVLASLTQPGLTVETLGPRRVSIGREAAYRVVVRNPGDGEARDVVVTLTIPEHAEVVGLRGTAGHSSSADESARSGALEWRLDAVAPRSEAELTLTLVPRRGEPIELGVGYTASTSAGRTVIEVEEPKLSLAVTGPNEVAFGEQRLFKLTVSNPGTGTAENVTLQLLPLTPGDGAPVRHAVGNLKPGESSVIEVELTARQAGALRIQTEATAEGDLRAAAAADVLVRRAVLDVVAAAPHVLFAGVPGTYEFRVRNSGDDAARNVRVAVDLPGGAKLLAANPATAGNAQSNQLTWTIDRIAPGSEQVCTVKCAWEQGGMQQLTATVAADGDLRKSAVAATDVQAVADLALDVVDTPGPVPVGRPVTFEIHVKNRGLKAAEGVDVVAYFSEGIEPERAEGQLHEIQPGMVIFRTLSSVGPGQEKVFKVTAKAQTSGNHRLRVELQSAAPQTQLSHEDATFFYDDAPADSTPKSPAAFQPQAASPIRPTNNLSIPGAAQPVRNASPSNYRVNVIR